MKKSVEEIIAGIDMVVNGLEKIKGALSSDVCSCSNNTAEAKSESKVVELKQVAKDVKPVENALEDRKAELEKLSYNELKSLVSRLGGKAVGKKDSIIQQILEIESSDEEDTVEDTVEEDNAEEVSEEVEEVEEEEEHLSREVLEDLLSDFTKDELIEVANEMGLKVKSKDTVSMILKALLKDTVALEGALVSLGYELTEEYVDVDDEDVEEEAEEVEEEEDDSTLNKADREEYEDTIEELNSWDNKRLKEFCEEHGISSLGKKQALVDRIIVAIKKVQIEEEDVWGIDYENLPLSDGHDSEDLEEEDIDEEVDDIEEEDVEEVDLSELVEELSTPELKSLAKALNVKLAKGLKRKDLISLILEQDGDSVYDTLVELGYVEDEEEEEVEESEDDRSVEEILNDKELSISDLKDIAVELGIKKSGKKRADIVKSILKKDEEEIREVIDMLFGEEQEEEIEVSEEVLEAEQSLEDDIRAKFSKKKLKRRALKSFVESYSVGDPDSDLDSLSDEELLDEYIEIKKQFINDEGEECEPCEYYERGEVGFCCGAPLVEKTENGNEIAYCEICGTEYSFE